MSVLTKSLSTHNQPNTTLKLQFDEHVGIDEYKLFEVTDDILAEIEQCVGTDTLQIKGQPNDEAVLVTQNHTYLIKCAETSNTVILSSIHANDTENTERHNKQQKLDTLQQSLHGFVTKHYELEIIQPKLNRLRDLLYQNIINESNINTLNTLDTTQLYTTQDLYSIIQCSTTELHTALKELGGTCINEYWYILDPDYQATIFDNILNVILQHKLDINAINCDFVCTQLNTLYTADIVKHVLQQYSTLNNDTQLYTLNQQKVCILKAQQLFTRKEIYPHTQFITDWIDSLPHSIKPDIAMLAGYAIYEPIPYALDNATIKRTSSTVGATIDMSTMQWKYFPVTSLSTIVRERFAQLFVAKQKWTLNQITPYVSDICPSTLTIEKFVMKNSRAINETVNDVKSIVYMKK